MIGYVKSSIIVTTSLLLFSLSNFSCSNDANNAKTAQTQLTAKETPDQGEVDAVERPNCKSNFQKFDSDNDGTISKDEFLSKPHVFYDPDAIFTARDQNHDNRLTLSEFCMLWTHRGYPKDHQGGSGMGGARGQRYGMHHGMGYGMGYGPMHGMHGGHMMGCEHHFEMFDANEDGKLSKEEFMSWPHYLKNAEDAFNARDKDKSGDLSKSEFCSKW